MLFLLLACASTGADTASAETCPVSSSEVGACPLDACAQDCPTAEVGVACCVAAHGYGNFDAVNLDRLNAACEADECDPAPYLSPAAALCVAQVHRLEPGIGWCGASFDISARGPQWTSRSTTLDTCEGGAGFGDVGYDAVQIDAISGAFSAEWQEIGLAECPG